MAGIGVGITNPVVASATVSVVPPERSGMSTGSSSTFRQVGIATGIAGLGAVFVEPDRPHDAQRPEPHHRRARPSCPTAGNRLDGVISGGTVRQTAATIGNGGMQHALIGAYQYGFTTTFNHLMAISTVIALVGSIGTLALVRQRDFVPSYAADAPVPTAGFDGAGRHRPGRVAVPRSRARAMPGPLRQPANGFEHRTGVPRVADGDSAS